MRALPLAGVAYAVLMLAGNSVPADGGALAWTAIVLETLGLLAFVLFVVALRARTGGAEGDVAFGAGLVAAGVKLSSFAFVLPSVLAPETVDAATGAALRAANDGAFVLTWPIDALLLAAVAAASLRRSAVPRWLGWSAGAVAAALGVAFLARGAGPAPLAFVASLAWCVVAGLALARAAPAPAAPSVAARS